MDVVRAPEVVGHHREVLEQRILAIAREDARGHVIEAEHEIGDAVLLLQRMGLVELLELVGRELDYVAEAERLDVVEIDVGIAHLVVGVIRERGEVEVLAGVERIHRVARVGEMDVVRLQRLAHGLDRLGLVDLADVAESASLASG